MKKKSSRAEKIQKTYYWWSKGYDAFLKFWCFWIKDAELEFMKILSQYGQSAPNILDVGVGTGNNIQRFLDLKISFNHYEGLDLTTEMLAKARKKFRKRKDISFTQGDITKIELKKKYDLIISTWVFSHLKYPEKVVLKLQKALKKDGKIILMFLEEGNPGSIYKKISDSIFRLFQAQAVSKKCLEKFPKARFEKHFPWIGGAVSIYVIA